MSSSNNIEYTQKELPRSLGKFGIALLALGLLLAVIAYLTDPVRSAFNNIILLEFLTSVGLGALFLVALEYIAGAVWSTPFRRIFEYLAAILLILPLVALPVYFHIHDVFHWSHEEVAQVLGKTVDATRSMQYRAMVSLRRMLIEDEEEDRNE